MQHKHIHHKETRELTFKSQNVFCFSYHITCCVQMIFVV